MLQRCAVKVIMAFFVFFPLSSIADTPSERIDNCKNQEMTLIRNQTQSFGPIQCDVRARAGVLAGFPPSCNRQEERGACVYTAPDAWIITNATFAPGSSWENASIEGQNWNSRTASATVKVNGHGCDRSDDAIAKSTWVGTIRREPTQDEINSAWKRCIDKELKP